MLMKTLKFYKNEHEFCLLQLKVDCELSGQAQDLAELVLALYERSPSCGTPHAIVNHGLTVWS